jgi:polar amino acid transport system substrate-binding protein
VTGNGLAPFAGRNLQHGGMASEIVARSIELAAPELAQEIAYLDNWQLRLDRLRSGALDVGFPWVRPNCDSGTSLTSQAQQLCSEFAFSRPFFSLPIAVYARADASFTELAGRTVCQAQEPYAIDTFGEVTAAASVIREETANLCFSRLLRGEVDAVQVLRPEAEKAVRLARIEGLVGEIEGLAADRTLHAVAPKSSHIGLAYLALIDAGLEKLMLSGEWFDIVAAHQSHRLALAK